MQESSKSNSGSDTSGAMKNDVTCFLDLLDNSRGGSSANDSGYSSIRNGDSNEPQPQEKQGALSFG